jgi:protein-tyrosine-phosphatase
VLLRKFKTLMLRFGANRALGRARETTDAVIAQAPREARILVVCHGNIYRSPLVATRLRELLGAQRVIVSAGFHPKGDRPSPEGHVAMSAAHGVDLSKHRSRVVDGGDLANADLIVLMDRRNWVNLRRAGADEKKYVWLGALMAGDVEIPDPYGLDAPAAERIVMRLVAATDALASRLKGR